MRLIIICALFFAGLAFYPAKAQEYRKLRLGAGTGFGATAGMQGSGGPVFYLEPAFLITDKLLIGLRIEAASITRGLSRSIAIDNPTTQYGSGSVFSQYYFGKKYLRAFIGTGAGIVSKSKEELIVDFGGVSAFQIGSMQLGLFFRAGMEWGHLHTAIDYNFIGDEIVSPFLEIKNSYPSIRVGILFGGGIH